MRISEKMLNARIDYLNDLTGNEREPYTKFGDNDYQTNLGNYHLSQAYGGVSLLQMSNKGGGVHDVFDCGHVPKRDLYNRINAYIKGIRLAQ